MQTPTNKKIEGLSNLNLEPGYKKVANAIEGQILSGQLKTGDLLPTETDLAQILGVHRSTVREGIRSLENAGLVQRGAKKRLQISAPKMGNVSSVVTRALGLKKVSFEELWEMQILLEPFAAKLASQRLSTSLKKKLEINVSNLKENITDSEYVVQNDTEFHHLIAEATQNAVLTLSAVPVCALLFSATVNLHTAIPQARYRMLKAHEAILKAIIAKDEEKAEAWMFKHIIDFKRGYELHGLDITEPINLDPRALDFVNKNLS